ncbi:MAG: sugar phosphate isomerase/epimerase [Planctomycetota bacterium]
MTEQLDIQWGISTLGCHELDLRSICELAARHGVHHLEIRSLADCLNLADYLDTTYPDDPDAVNQILGTHNQSIIALNSGFTLIDANEQARNELLGFARWAERLKVPFIRVFGGSSMNAPLSRSEVISAVASLTWWHAVREENGWTTRIALETHHGFSSGARCLELQEAFGNPLDVIWDTHHTWKLGAESARQTWAQISHMVRHLHIKDSIPVPSARHEYSYVLPGKGDFPATDVFTVLAENSFKGVVSLEWERKWHPYMTDLDEALTELSRSGWMAGSPLQPVIEQP